MPWPPTDLASVAKTEFVNNTASYTASAFLYNPNGLVSGAVARFGPGSVFAFNGKDVLPDAPGLGVAGVLPVLAAQQTVKCANMTCTHLLYS